VSPPHRLHSQIDGQEQGTGSGNRSAPRVSRLYFCQSNVPERRFGAMPARMKYDPKLIAQI
jgi:hypothetical protein